MISCKRCTTGNDDDANYCKNCGVLLERSTKTGTSWVPRWHDREGVSASDLRALINPLIELMGKMEVARRAGVSPRALDQLLERDRVIPLSTVDKYLTPLGLTNALRDKTLRIVPNPSYRAYEYNEFAGVNPA